MHATARKPSDNASTSRLQGRQISRIYSYVGPEEIQHASIGMPRGAFIFDLATLTAWLDGETCEDHLTATFTVDTNLQLQLADRHSEHVACAAGGPVTGAGEITFAREDERGEWYVIEITNQSTGFCPEPSCWDAVTKALDMIGVHHPDYFTRAYDFRRCEQCGELALIKEQWFECVHCGVDLPREYNLD
jgi:hypothetical protein